MKGWIVPVSALVAVIVHGYVYAEPAPRKIKVGVLAPLSGVQSFIGQAQRSAAQLALKDDSALSDAVEIFYQDSSGGERAVLAAYQMLTSGNSVDVVYAVEGEYAPLLAEQAEKSKIPLFAVNADLRTTAGKKYSSLFFNEGGELARAIWDELRRQSKKALYIVQEPNGYYSALNAGLSGNTMSDETVEVDPGDGSNYKEHRAIIQRIRRKKFDALGVFLNVLPAKAFLTALEATGVKMMIFTPTQFASAEEAAALEPLLREALFVLPLVSDAFRERFKREYRNQAGVEYGALFYDFLNLAKQTITEKPELFDQPEKFISAMRFDDERIGATGPFCVKRTAHRGVYYSFPIGLYKFQDGELVVHRRFERPV